MGGLRYDVEQLKLGGGGGGGGGSVAADALWDAAGDLAVGTGANTAARLPKGSNDTVLTVVSGSVAWAAPASAATIPTHVVHGRLTLTSGLPVTVSDVTSATSVYFTPYNGDTITLWNGTAWQQYTFTEKTLALGTLTSGKPYDVFGYLSSGVLAVEALVWTSDLVRATAVTLQDGRYCKSGDKTRLYLGTFYTTSTTTTEDSLTKRYLFNQYNRVKRICSGPAETTDSWNYTSTTWRQANGSSSNQFEYVNGDPGHYLRALTRALQSNSSGGVGNASGVGIDSTSTNSARYFGNGGSNVSGFTTVAEYNGYPGIGRHYIVWLEMSAASGTATWYGDAGTPLIHSNGIIGEVDL